MTTLLLIAKEPLPGHAKTRLHPPLSLEQAAQLAAAAIHDTADATRALPASRRVLLFAGSTPPAGVEDFEILPQTDGTLDVRLAAAFDALEGPTVLIGMDTPQVTADLLAPAFENEWPADAYFGPAADGGFWALGLREPRGDLIRGVEMSTDATGAEQLARLRAAGLDVRLLPELTDVDTIDDARRVAASAPDTRFARLLASFEETR
jgi:glycosyltransferase A (GT-A) superfamily protein (DUF2064 family)